LYNITTADITLAQEQATIELPPITVFAKRSNNSVSESSAVAWQNANDSTIIRENDGSYTASSVTNSYSIMAFLASQGRPTLNIDIGYAANSVSMTAEGHLIVNTLVEGLAYFDEGVSLELTPILKNTQQTTKTAMARRLEILRKELERNETLELKIMPPSNRAIGAVKSATQSDIWRIKIRRSA